MNYVLGVLLYMFIGLLIAVRHVHKIRKAGHEDFNEQLKFIREMVFLWPRHFYILLGVWLLNKMWEIDDET